METLVFFNHCGERHVDGGAVGSWLTRCIFIFWRLCDLKRDQQTAVGSVSKKCFYDCNGFDVLVLVHLHGPVQSVLVNVRGFSCFYFLLEALR